MTRKKMDDMNAKQDISQRAYDAWQQTKKYLREVYGDDYYEKDYAEGVRLGINRPVRDVLVDEVNRGWRDAADIERYDAKHKGEWEVPQEERPCGPRCKALAEKWQAEATGKVLSKEENASRLKTLMRAMAEDQQDAREKKYLDRAQRQV